MILVTPYTVPAEADIFRFFQSRPAGSFTFPEKALGRCIYTESPQQHGIFMLSTKCTLTLSLVNTYSTPGICHAWYICLTHRHETARCQSVKNLTHGSIWNKGISGIIRVYHITKRSLLCMFLGKMKTIK